MFSLVDCPILSIVEMLDFFYWCNALYVRYRGFCLGLVLKLKLFFKLSNQSEE